MPLHLALCKLLAAYLLSLTGVSMPEESLLANIQYGQMVSKHHSVLENGNKACATGLNSKLAGVTQ